MFLNTRAYSLVRTDLVKLKQNDREDPRLRDLSLWKVQSRTCRFVHSVSCEVDFYSHLRREFRTEQTEKAILIKKQVVPETALAW